MVQKVSEKDDLLYSNERARKILEEEIKSLNEQLKFAEDQTVAAEARIKKETEAKIKVRSV